MEKNCINCEGFAWWDGDYCCLPRMEILCNGKNGEFSDEILKTMKTSEECKKYKKRYSKKLTEMYQEAFDKFLKENEGLA